MGVISITEFQNLTGISDSVLLYLLKHRRVPVSIDPALGIMIDAAALETGALMQSLLEQQDQILVESKDVITERFGAILREECTLLFQEAIARAKDQSTQAETAPDSLADQSKSPSK